ncbi:MAG: hypothetical protein PHD46_02440 [Eubacteriales bacterium]|nr:hypothetical protein [Eubacteriales bacterium]MDD4421875.1 hypothetical protein [Eubacteriales bacterium]
MQRNTKNKGIVLIILLVITAVLSVTMASCVRRGERQEEEEVIFEQSGEESVDTSEETTVSTPEGHTEMPVIKDNKNMTADIVVIAGTCEEGAIVEITGGEEDVTVESRNGYFIAQIKLEKTSKTMLKATALVEGKEKSEPRVFYAEYLATAEKRIDGYGVSVGTHSQLYFDTYLDNYIGMSLLTETQLKNFRSYVNGKVSTIESKAKGKPAELVYVLIPDVTSLYPDIFPEGTERKTYTTKYQQVAKELANTSAITIDMYDILAAARDAGEYEIFRKNDSHLTEYGAYLVYEQIANTLALNFPDAKARTLEEFTEKMVLSEGGDLMSYIGINKEHYKENVLDLIPNADINLDIGFSDSENISVNISDIRKYVSDTDYSMYVTPASSEVSSSEKIVGINDRFVVATDRENLPSALIYRDNAAFPMLDILAERFNKVMIAKSEQFGINFTDANRYKAEGRDIVDYIIVIVSESNLDKILSDPS